MSKVTTVTITQAPQWAYIAATAIVSVLLMVIVYAQMRAPSISNDDLMMLIRQLAAEQGYEVELIPEQKTSPYWTLIERRAITVGEMNCSYGKTADGAAWLGPCQ